MIKNYYKIKFSKRICTAACISLFDLPTFTDLRTFCNLPLENNFSLLENAIMQSIVAGASSIFIMCPKEHIYYFKQRYKTYVTLYKGEKRIGTPIYWITRVEQYQKGRKRVPAAYNFINCGSQAHWYFKSISNLYTPDYLIHMPVNCIYDCRFLMMRHYTYKQFKKGYKISCMNKEDPENYPFTMRIENFFQLKKYYVMSKNSTISFKRFITNNKDNVYKIYLGWSHVIKSFEDYRDYVRSDVANYFKMKMTFKEDYNHVWLHKDKDSSIFTFRNIWQRDNYMKKMLDGIKPSIYKSDREELEAADELAEQERLEALSSLTTNGEENDQQT